MSDLLNVPEIEVTPGPVEAAILAAGFRPGFPSHVHKLTQSADHRCAHRMRCPSCRARMRLLPFHKGGAYRAVAECACGHQEEM